MKKKAHGSKLYQSYIYIQVINYIRNEVKKLKIFNNAIPSDNMMKQTCSRISDIKLYTSQSFTIRPRKKIHISAN